MMPIARHLAAAILLLGTAAATAPSPASAAPGESLVQPIQYYRHGYYGRGYYGRPVYRGYYGRGYGPRPYFRHGPGFYRHGPYRRYRY